MQFEFVTDAGPIRNSVENHIREVYARTYGARVEDFAPLLAMARNADGKILCAAGIRQAQDGFFSECYVDESLPDEVTRCTGLKIPATQIMEVSSLASVSPFPVLPLLDRVISWGRERGIVCGVFTATLPLRRMLTRAGLGYTPICPASAGRLTDPPAWGRYYDTDPWVCAFLESDTRRASLTPTRAAIRHEGAA